MSNLLVTTPNVYYALNFQIFEWSSPIVFLYISWGWLGDLVHRNKVQREFERVHSTHLTFSRETLTIPLQENKLFTPVNILNQISFSRHSIFFSLLDPHSIFTLAFLFGCSQSLKEIFFSFVIRYILFFKLLFFAPPDLSLVHPWTRVWNIFRRH